MQNEETIGVLLSSSVERPPLQDVVVLVDSAGVAIGVQRAFSARVLGDRDSDLIASRWVEIPIIGSNGEISGILCHTSPPSDGGGAVAAGERERAMAELAEFVVHEINNVFAVIASGLRLLECQNDAAYRKAILGNMQEAVRRGSVLSQQFLEASRPRPKSIDGFVAGSRLATIAGTVEQALHPDITVHTEIAPDLWAFSADAEELYFALLNLCRNSADAMPDGGVITVAARNAGRCSDETRGFVEIVVADNGEGMPEEVLSQALDPYFTTKSASRSPGLGLAEVRRFAEERNGGVRIESKPGVGTLVRLLLPRVEATGLRRSTVGTEVAYSPSPEGGVFHVISPAIAAPTS
ncbi:ATP-binding protein [Chelatococcus sp. GCM10030263]|uniref:ATP-binding protein n=1 Tax=Chelatococcus sp. GCM10030263 TaxID=3273387 RepID=UPI0036129C12